MSGASASATPAVPNQHNMSTPSNSVLTDEMDDQDTAIYSEGYSETGTKTSSINMSGEVRHSEVQQISPERGSLRPNPFKVDDDDEDIYAGLEDPEENQTEPSTPSKTPTVDASEGNKTDPPSPSKTTVASEYDTKSDDDSENGSPFWQKFGRGGSFWTRRNTLIAVIGGLALLIFILSMALSSRSLEGKIARERLPAGANEQPNDDDQPDDRLPDGVTFRPTAAPFILPSAAPSTFGPSAAPSYIKSEAPSPIGPSPRPTPPPTGVPSRSPSEVPTLKPTRNPTGAPSRRPTSQPSMVPTKAPTGFPSRAPSRNPSASPSLLPTNIPSAQPTFSPAGIMRTLLALVDVTSGQTLEAIERPKSPQGKAFNWLIEDPNFLEYPNFRLVQRFALACLYFSVATPGDSEGVLASWVNYDTDECMWFLSWYENRSGCGSDGIFKFLTLRNINLVGTIPAELALLNRLESLVLRDNALMGQIPGEFGRWTSLQNLDLRGNFLGGPIPNFNGTNLVSIDLSWNQLGGTIPRGFIELDRLESVDLTENFIYGSVPNRLCSKNLQTLGVDCNEVTCGCCDKCGASEETRFPVEAPPFAPTRPPTPFPTPPPTPGPTRSPTPPPTPGPTTPPTPGPTPLPTPRPTPRPTLAPTPCPEAAIQVTKTCFTVGEAIVVNYNNCNPVGDSFVGIYPDSVQAGEHTTPPYWKFACNSQSCSTPIGRGTVIMDSESSGTRNWPLQTGEYKAWLFNDGFFMNPPTPAIVGTSKFFVRGQC